MMTIKDQIDEALKGAIRSRDEVKKNALRGLLTAIKNREKDLKREPNDTEVLQIISSQIKQRRESIEQFKSGGREDLAEREAQEIAVLEAFLPKALSREELEAIIEECIRELGANTVKDMGKVMKAVMPKIAGRADGKLVNELVRQKLS
ncbi:MAG: GatB/YqeY domain-containing protein [Syntrophobacterales bacterium]|nr:GatB/YqeY domain-containing protein [Syntrophobacterales bacterium]